MKPLFPVGYVVMRTEDHDADEVWWDVISNKTGFSVCGKILHIDDAYNLKEALNQASELLTKVKNSQKEP